MVRIQDEGSVFEASLDEVLGYLGSGAPHSAAHRHRRVRRVSNGPGSGTYSWEQAFEGHRTDFSMRWTSYLPLGLAYDVLVGPFAGSKFFLYYVPRGDGTAVSVVGEFESPTIPLDRLETSLRRFLATEFDQDAAGLERWRGRPRRRVRSARPA
jgi:hypothetical protein